MNSRDVARRLRQVPWPEPSRELRARVLAEGTVRPPLVAWSDRVWFSRTWRLSMAALVIAVLTIRAWPVPANADSIDLSRQAIAQAKAIEETGSELGVPDVAASLARRALGRSRTRTMTFSTPALQFFYREETRRD